MVAEKNNKNLKMTSFIKRLLSGIFLLFALFFILLTGDNLLFFSCLVLSIIGVVEILKVFKLANSRLAIVGYCYTILYYIMIYIYKTEGILLFLIAMLLLLLMFYVFSYPKFSIKQVSIVFFSIIYVAIMFSFIYLIREKIPSGKYLVWLVFITSWGCDTCAYCVGMLFGKHKLSPILSPKKTIEGAIGGIIGSSLLGILYTYIILNHINNSINFSYIQIALSCSIGAIISIIGDLTASGIKRDCNVKDYGDIIPGHGGILDRFDSVIFTAPALFFLLSI